MKARSTLYDPRQLPNALVDLEKIIFTLEAKRPEWPFGESPVNEAGLVSLKRAQDTQDRINHFRDLYRAWHKEVLRSAAELGGSQSEVAKALGTKPVRSFMRAIHTQASRRGGQFAAPMARHRLLLAVVQGLEFYEKSVSSGCPPRSPGRKDWLAAEQAFESLVRCVQSGVPVTPLAASFGVTGLAEDNMGAIMASLRKEARLAKKPHADRYSNCRLACKEFAKNVYLVFGGVAPAALIDKFSLLLGYGSEKVLRTYLKQWISEFDRLFKPTVIPATFNRKGSRSSR